MQSQWQERFQTQASNRERDHRNPFQRDKARVLHSAAFRRLQAKTQVHGVGMSDFHRTRLTHSLEASQIGQGIAAQLAIKQPELAAQLHLDDTLIETLCLAHDIGHPPFGHGGEIALHYMMREHGGFEGNGQTFRIVTRLEPYTPANGMNLCRRTVLGLVKYPAFINQMLAPEQRRSVADFRQLKASEWYPPKGLFDCDKEMYDWVTAPLSDPDKSRLAELTAGKYGLRTCYKSLDCSIMELADDIAYGIHDLEDAITMGIVQAHHFESMQADLKAMQGSWFATHADKLAEQLFSPHHYSRKDAIGALVNQLVTSIELRAHSEPFDNPLLTYNAVMDPEAKAALDMFKGFVYEHVINQPSKQRHEYKGQQIIMQLFEAFSSDPERLLPANTAVRWQRADGEHAKARVISDYLSGMTDDYATRMFANLFLPGTLHNHHS